MIVRSRFPNADIPDISYPDLMLDRFDRHGDAVAMVDSQSGRSYTYKQISIFARNVASAMINRGLQKGDVFALHLPNVAEYPILLYGVPLVGGIITPLNPHCTDEELTFQLKSSRAKYIITTPPFAEKIKNITTRLGMVKEVFVLGNAPGCTPFADLIGDGCKTCGFKVDPRNDVFCLPYSSGTTGLPKGVMLTHRNLVAYTAIRFAMAPPSSQRSSQPVTLIFLPLYHIYMLSAGLGLQLYRGSKVVLIAKYDGESMLQCIQKFRVTSLFLVPAVVVYLAKHPALDKYDLSSLRSVGCGGAPLQADVQNQLNARLPRGVHVWQGYGLTETSPGITVQVAASSQKPGSCGILLPNLEAKIIDVETRAILGPGQDGELCVRGPTIMKGYINNPKATANSIDRHGWFHTGDIGHYDNEEAFFITGRLKELIKYKGFQVPPAELENILLSHPSVVDAAVIGIPNPEAGELPKAFVVPRGGVTPSEIAAFVSGKVSPYKKLRGGVEFVKEIPKTASGKILRREILKNEMRKLQQKL